MSELSYALQDPELGFTAFTVLRTTCRRRDGRSVPAEQLIRATGCIHPGTPEMLQLLPEEERSETFIVIYTDFALSTGSNDGGETIQSPDRILWNNATWRLVRTRDWAAFGYYVGYAVRVCD